MFGPLARRVFVLVLLALAFVWPVAMPVADITYASQPSATASVPMTGGCRDCDHGTTRGTCPAAFCAVPPAVLPAPSPDHRADACRLTPFALVDEHGHGRMPDVTTPPPKPSPLT